jgi:LEA14-like dessication related protein
MACSGYKQDIADNISYRVMGIDIDAVTNIQNSIGSLFSGDIEKASEGELKINLEITNSNDIDLEMKEIKYNVSIHDIYIGRGILSKDSIIIKANRKNSLTLPLKINMQTLLKNGINLITSKDISIKVKGSCLYSGIFGEESIPFVIENGKININ